MTAGKKWTTGNDPAPPVWKTGMLPITPCPHMPEIGTSNIFPFGRLVNGVDSPSLMGKEFSSRFQGSNLGPSACKADALPAELNRDRSRQRGSNPHSLRWQRSAIADFAMPAYGRRKCLFLSPLFSCTHLFGKWLAQVKATPEQLPVSAFRLFVEPRGVEPRSHALQARAE